MMGAHITIHAVRRYAERVLRQAVPDELDDVEAMQELDRRGIDLQAIRDRLHDACDLAAEKGALGVKLDNARALLRDGNVVTILGKGPAGHVYERAAP